MRLRHASPPPCIYCGATGAEDITPDDAGPLERWYKCSHCLRQFAVRFTSNGSAPVPVIVWQISNVICRSRTLALDEIEITIARDTEILEVAVFTNIDAAADYAFAKMHDYIDTPPSFSSRPN